MTSAKCRSSSALLLAIALTAGSFAPLPASDEDLVPATLVKAQRENLTRFLREHEKPSHYVPADARITGPDGAPVAPPNVAATPEKPIKQYMVQILSHRPVPEQEEAKRVDVYYYRPNPEQGKQGITVRYTVDLETGKQVGASEVLLNRHTPLSRDELTEAVTLARQKSQAVQKLYRDGGMVRWEYLQLMIGKKHEHNDPGDRAVRLVFTAPTIDEQQAPSPVRVIVNLTKNVVSQDDR